MGSDVQWSASLVGLQSVWLIVEDSVCGRRDSLQLTYEIFGAEFDSLSVPNVYTPNGDNINDVFCLKQAEASALMQLSLRVFSRWGQEVFATTDPQFLWDGRFQGRDLSSGVYLYHLSWQSKCGTSGDQQGAVTLNR